MFRFPLLLLVCFLPLGAVKPNRPKKLHPASQDTKSQSSNHSFTAKKNYGKKKWYSYDAEKIKNNEGIVTDEQKNRIVWHTKSSFETIDPKIAILLFIHHLHPNNNKQDPRLSISFLLEENQEPEDGN